jgi:TonB family protein
MQLEFVASGSGSKNLRRPVAQTNPSRGALAGGVSVQAGTAPGAAPSDDERAFLQPGSEVAGGEPKPAQGVDTLVGHDFRPSVAIVTARPAVLRDRAAVPAVQRDRPSDNVDSRQRVSARVAGLMQASTLGGDGAAGVGGEPAPFAAPPAAAARFAGTGSRSAPTGPGLGLDLATDPDLQGFYRAVLAQLDRALSDAFPRWAIAEGRGGLVVFDLTIHEDGRLASVAVVRPSGIDEYDQNVVDGVRRIASFGRVPHEFGSRAVLRINWDSLNPAVGRHGPGPGRRP